ncbi:butyrate kinase [candidate division WOR-3 bacterium]|nr:butyrate kinase [candidate division WOR-3 bacterium]
MYEIFVINPGSTSTKVGWFEDDKKIFVKNILHSKEEIQSFKRINDQLGFRKDAILNALEEENKKIEDFDVIVGRGGLLRPIESGTYSVNERMLRDLHKGYQGEHASNLGGILASELGKRVSIPAFIVDPVTVDEMDPVAKITGRPEIKRRSIFHALNHKTTARKIAKEIGKDYTDLNLIIAHLGGGISIGAHKKGRVVDINNALNGDGPFAPERAGGLPVWDTINYFLSNNFSPEEIKKKITGDAGVVAYLGTNDMREVEKRIKEGDKKAEEIFNALIYQVSKEIGKLAPVFYGKVDAIVLTGGLARDEKFTDEVKKRVEFIAPVYFSPGEDEMKALAFGALQVFKGEEKVKEY